VSESVELSEIRQSLQARRQAVIDEFRLKPNADRLVHELRRITDDALRQLLRLHPLPKQAALTAVGGYGVASFIPTRTWTCSSC